MLYGQPAWALATAFRPFLWGFMLLGSEHGLSFFWTARLACLLLVSYEFGRFLTNDDRCLSFAYAVLVGFGPVLQWWFAINGIAELFIFGQLLVLLFDKYWLSSSVIGRWAVAAGIAYCAGGYALVLYPAWQVPLFYVFAALGVAVFIQDFGIFSRRLKGGRHSNRRFAAGLLPICVMTILLIVVLLTICWQSREAIRLVANTAYPGARKESGGGLLQSLSDYVSSPLLALDADSAIPNAPERASFFTLFPVGIILALMVLAKHRDSKLMALLLCDLFLLAYGLFGFPSWLSSATLLSMVTTGRLELATSFLDIILLIRSLTLLPFLHRPGTSDVNGHDDSPICRVIPRAIISMILAVFLVALADRLSECPLNRVFTCLALAILAVFLFSVFSAAVDKQFGVRLVASASVMVLISGLCVNPIQHGASAILDNPVPAMVRSELGNRTSTAKLVTDDPYIGQGMVASGIPAITSANTMPALKRWHKLDPDRRYEKLYNRYAFVQIQLQAKGSPSFELAKGHPDYLIVHMTANDLVTIGATHILSKQNPEEYQTDDVRFAPMGQANGFTLYRIVQRQHFNAQ
ncbi:hypothetical protein G1C95_2187 [Bifidobacterium sp. DSM 109957]|uniref:Uncharacterized protein n=2 Tax=Bifidobacterium oedipodis TaxID=2675322 RepID=A0A7Y0HUQ4_9BIFI|nr:hypothetical protein [Bifidobacterium sp. DSM 109957]